MGSTDNPKEKGHGVGIGWEASIYAQGDGRFSHRHSVLSNDGCERFKKGFRRETV